MALTMARGHIGVDIGTTAVRAAEIRGTSQPTVARFGQVLLPRGAVVDGEVVDVGAVAQALTTLWKRAGFTSRDVLVGVANRRVVVRQLELPAMSREDLDGAIRFQAEEYIPIPLTEAVMDFEVVEEVTGPEGEALQRVLVVAAERAMIGPLVEALHLAKLSPQGIDLNAYPLVRALGHDEAVGDAEAIVDVGGGVTNVVVHQGGRIRFTRILPGLGGDAFTEALADAMGVDWDEAEALKLRASKQLAAHDDEDVDDDAAEEGADDDAETDTLGRAVTILSTVMTRFVGEVRGSIDFYTSQSDTMPLGRVILTGGGVLLGGLHEQVASALRVPVELGHPFDRTPVGKVRISPEQIPVAEPFLAVAIGLALGGLEH